MEEVEMEGICKYCRHRKVKKVGNIIAADYCKYYANRPTCYPECHRCRSFSQSIKSRLGLIK